MHIDRIRLQRAYAMAQGMGIALSDEKIPKPYFDAIAPTEAEVDEQEFQANAERERASVLAKVKAGTFDGGLFGR
jgi:hypothetical protein